MELDDFDEQHSVDDDDVSSNNSNVALELLPRRADVKRDVRRGAGAGNVQQLGGSKTSDVDMWPAQKQKQCVNRNQQALVVPEQKAKRSRARRHASRGAGNAAGQRNGVTKENNRNKVFSTQANDPVASELLSDNLDLLTSPPFDCDKEGRSRSPQVSPFQKVKQWMLGPQVTPEPIEQSDVELSDLSSRQKAADVIAKRASRKRKKARSADAATAHDSSA